MSEEHRPHGAHGRRPGLAARLRRFRRSELFPACVLVLILGAAAGLFAGSYTYAMADPAPHRIPTAVLGSADEPRSARFVAAMERELDSSMVLERYDSEAAASDAVGDQQVFAVLRLGDEDPVRLQVSSASGASVAQLLSETAPRAGEAAGVAVEVDDLKPLDPGDPRGLAIFYISLAAVIIGFVGAIQLSVHARGLNPLERILFTAAYALFGGLVITVVVDVLLGAVDLPFAASWMILALTMFTAGMVFTMFNTLFGRWAMLPTWGLMVLLGNPSSGGAVSWPLLPSPFGAIGRWLPPGGSVNAQHTAVYFPEHQHVQPYLALGGWALVSCTVFWFWRHRHPGGRPSAPAHAGTA